MHRAGAQRWSAYSAAGTAPCAAEADPAVPVSDRRHRFSLGVFALQHELLGGGRLALDWEAP